MSIGITEAALAATPACALSVTDCEAWAKRDTWQAISEGLPLLLGVKPEAWISFTAAPAVAHAAQSLGLALAVQLGLPHGADPALPPQKLRAAAQHLAWPLPPALDRLLDFIARILPSSVAGDPDLAEAQVLAAQARETLLGAALLLVTRMPRDCVDELGYYDPTRIARLIRQKALLWFPLAPPALDEAGIAALLAKWLPGRGTD